MADSISEDSTNANEPKARRVHVERRVRTVSFEIPELKVARPFQGFVNFIREQGVVGLGVGFVVGTSASTLVKSIVANVFNPLIGVVTGGNQLNAKLFCLDRSGNNCTNKLYYGQVLSDLITFLLILFLVYLLIKSLKLDKIDKKKS